MLITLNGSTLLEWVANRRRTTISYLGSREQAKADCAAADIQIDGNDPGSTSPVMHGGSSFGMAPMEGTTEFTKERTRPSWKGRRTSMRREFPTEGVSGK